MDLLFNLRNIYDEITDLCGEAKRLRQLKWHKQNSQIKPGFHLSKKPQTIGDLTVSRGPSQMKLEIVDIAD